MSYVIKTVRPRHHLIIQYAFNGLSNRDIAVKIGMSPAGIGCILRSPAAQAELARLANLAVEKSVDIPARVALHNELVGAATDGLRINKTLMKDPFVKPETRSRIGQHFMDRVLFDKRDGDDREQESYRDILRKLDKLQATIQEAPGGAGAEVINVEVAHENGDSHPQLNLDVMLEQFTGNDGKHVIDLGEDD